MKRLELYGNNMADYHLVTDLLPNMARLYFLYGLANEVHLSALQQAILLGVGLQVKKITPKRLNLAKLKSLIS